MKKKYYITVTIEKLVFGGQALAYFEDHTVFIWNALPGEVCRVLVTKRKKSHWEGLATEILSPSKYRIKEEEAHYLSSSPWGIMSIEKELDFKQSIATETYQHIGKMALNSGLDIFGNNQLYGYRNKIEFSFYEYNDDDQTGKGVTLAFFQRGQKYKVPVVASLLAEPVINNVAQQILEWINDNNLTRYNLKTLIVRSNGKGEAIAALFLKDHLKFHSYPNLDEKLTGFHIYYSNPQSPASVPTELIYSAGQNYLIATIQDTKLKFGLLGFFQVNISVFEQALKEISQWIPENKPLIDFYAGVGAISLPLSKHFTSALLVDNNEEAIQYAHDNIALNNIKNCTAELIAAENITAVITSEHTVVVDPPRAGLHKDVTEKLLREKPHTIIYLSCNLSTQARDIQLLQTAYTVEFMKLYNFFPRTPHIEGLCVLKRPA